MPIRFRSELVIRKRISSPFQPSAPSFSSFFLSFSSSPFLARISAFNSEIKDVFSTLEKAYMSCFREQLSFFPLFSFPLFFFFFSFLPVGLENKNRSAGKAKWRRRSGRSRTQIPGSITPNRFLFPLPSSSFPFPLPAFFSLFFFFSPPPFIAGMKKWISVLKIVNDLRSLLASRSGFSLKTTLSFFLSSLFFFPLFFISLQT